MTTGDIICYTLLEEYAQRIPKGTALSLMEYTGRNQNKLCDWLTENGVESIVKDKTLSIKIDMIGADERQVFELRRGTFPAVYEIEDQKVATVFYRDPTLFMKVRKKRKSG